MCVVIAVRVMRENVEIRISHVTLDGQLASRSSSQPRLRGYVEILSSFKIYRTVVMRLILFFLRSHTLLAMHGVSRGFLNTGDSDESKV
jgi:hypothetical protein